MILSPKEQVCLQVAPRKDELLDGRTEDFFSDGRKRIEIKEIRKERIEVDLGQQYLGGEVGLDG